jgi:hypothetical protein
MMGRWTQLEDINEPLKIKVSKMLSSVGQLGLKNLARTREVLRKEVLESLLAGRSGAKEYVLDSNKKFTPKTHQPA